MQSEWNPPHAIPAGLLLLWHWREKFWPTVAGVDDPGPPAKSLAPGNSEEIRKYGPLPFWVELSLYASMPLFHFHTFLALSIVLFCFFALEFGLRIWDPPREVGASTPQEEAHPAPVKAAPVRRAVLQQWTELSGTSLPGPIWGGGFGPEGTLAASVVLLTLIWVGIRRVRGAHGLASNPAKAATS